MGVKKDGHSGKLIGRRRAWLTTSSTLPWCTRGAPGVIRSLELETPSLTTTIEKQLGSMERTENYQLENPCSR